jgi:hypothetical protein
MASMTSEIQELINSLTPKGELGIMTKSDILWYIRTASEKGALIGYTHATKFTEERLKRVLDAKMMEIDALTSEIKRLEKEIMFLAQ